MNALLVATEQQWLGTARMPHDLAAGTPANIVERLHREIVRIRQRPDVRDVFIGQGAEPVGNTPDAFAAEIKGSIARWEPVIKAAGIRLE